MKWSCQTERNQYLHGRKEIAKSVGVALGSGALRGVAHIGVLKAIDSAGIQVDAIAGSSIGAFIGALYCKGVSPIKMEEIALKLSFKDIISFLKPRMSRKSLVSGEGYINLLQKLIGNVKFSDLLVPLFIIVTNLETGESEVVKDGDVLEAVRASMAVPGLIEPVIKDGKILVDGGLTKPLPVDVLKKSGLDVVIASSVSVKHHKLIKSATYSEVAEVVEYQEENGAIGRVWNFLWGREKKKANSYPGIFSIISRALAVMNNKVEELTLELYPPDILIDPKLERTTLKDVDKIKGIISKAYCEAVLKLKEAGLGEMLDNRKKRDTSVSR